MIKLITYTIFEHEGQILFLGSNDEGQRFRLPSTYIEPDGSKQPYQATLDSLKRLIDVPELATRLVLINSSVRLLEDTTCAIFLVYSCNLDGVGADDLRLQTSGYRWIKMTEVQQYNVDQSSHFVLSQIDVLKERLKGSASDSELDSYVAEKSTKTNELVIYTDGGARGNPGPSASGFVIMTTSDEVLEEGGEYIGITTNNQAEYQAVKLALIAAKKYHPQRISFRMDSELVVRQMTGDYQITNRDLWPVHTFITEAMKEFKRVDFTHVRRELNRAADAKVNEILDAHERQERSH